MLRAWLRVRFADLTFRVRHALKWCSVFGGQLSPPRRECHGGPCVFSKGLLHNLCFGEEASLRSFTMARRKTIGAVCAPTFGCATAMSTLSVARLLIALQSWRHFRDKIRKSPKGMLRNLAPGKLATCFKTSIGRYAVASFALALDYIREEELRLLAEMSRLPARHNRYFYPLLYSFQWPRRSSDAHARF
jgi:hypothetical protein